MTSSYDTKSSTEGCQLFIDNILFIIYFVIHIVVSATVVAATIGMEFNMHGDLSILSRGIETYVSRRLADTDSDLSSRELFFLVFLYRKEGLKQEDLARHFMIDKGAVARTLEGLEAKGLIKRYVNPDNRREKQITVTSEGLQLKQMAMSLNREWHDLMLAGIPKNELTVFADVLGKMSANITASLKSESI